MKKRCSVCGVVKFVEEFHFKNKTKEIRRSWCKSCVAEYHRTHYQKNKEDYAKRSKSQRLQLTKLLRELKSAPCTDCGASYPWYVMQFDHTGDDKRKAVAYLVNYGSECKLLEEVKKCQLVCANCHAIRTYARLECDGASEPSKL